MPDKFPKFFKEHLPEEEREKPAAGMQIPHSEESREEEERLKGGQRKFVRAEDVARAGIHGERNFHELSPGEAMEAAEHPDAEEGYRELNEEERSELRDAIRDAAPATFNHDLYAAGLRAERAGSSSKKERVHAKKKERAAKRERWHKAIDRVSK